ncbi:hypothetical protein CC77DRAFT_1012736 [Alternaria alternata]|uniref:Uncharacterized protein n=1 Tax=Alternaria alternata TaxID=5599 RepID=A0A177D963_ALTAL|nr:hypothetical protein CC77DRAFT_1012736 [Alternaria alternata]OAG16066.1 hypothetical protein CC77DRAFT_1012736 [Alternaria alternata]
MDRKRGREDTPPGVDTDASDTTQIVARQPRTRKPVPKRPRQARDGSEHAHVPDNADEPGDNDEPESDKELEGDEQAEVEQTAKRVPKLRKRKCDGPCSRLLETRKWYKIPGSADKGARECQKCHKARKGKKPPPRKCDGPCGKLLEIEGSADESARECQKCRYARNNPLVTKASSRKFKRGDLATGSRGTRPHRLDKSTVDPTTDLSAPYQTLADVYEERVGAQLDQWTTAINAVVSSSDAPLIADDVDADDDDDDNETAMQNPIAPLRLPLADKRNAQLSQLRNEMRSLSKAPSRDGRNYVSSFVSTKLVLSESKTIDEYRYEVKQGSERRLMAVAYGPSYSKDVALRVASSAVGILNSFPGELDLVSTPLFNGSKFVAIPAAGNKIITALLELELEGTWDPSRLRLPTPEIDKLDPLNNDKLKDTIEWTFYDHYGNCGFTQDPTSKEDIHKTGLYDPNVEQLEQTEGRLENNLQTEKLLRCLSAHLARTTFVRLDDFKVFCDSWISKIATNYWHRYDVLHLFETAAGLVTIAPDERIEHRFPGLPKFPIPSRDYSRAMPVVTTIVNAWLRSGDIREAWLEGAVKYEAVCSQIVAGEPSSTACSCNEDSQHSTVHPCGSCHGIFLCSRMQKGIFAPKICASCFQLESSDPAAAIDERALKIALRNAKVRGAGTMSEALESVRKFVCRTQSPGGGLVSARWEDYMTSTMRAFSATATAHDGFRISVDAVFPFGIASSGEIHHHAPSNLRLTSTAFNSAKGIHLPAIMAVISDYIRAVGDAEEDTAESGNLHDRLESFSKSLFERLAACRRVRLKCPSTKALREKQTLNDEVFKAMHEQWVSGKLVASDQLEDAKTYKSIDAVKWSTEDLTRLKFLINQLEKEFGVSVTKSTDGCPVVARLPKTSTSSQEWSWVAAANFFFQRLDRLRKRCNRWDATIDTPITLFVECIFQICVGLWDETRPMKENAVWSLDEKKAYKKKYGDLLGLPIVLQAWHPLCLSIGHYHHGLQMRTGWPPDATEMSHRKEGVANISFETSFSNQLKRAYPSSQYQELRAEMKKINLAKEYYDPDLEPADFEMPAFEGGDEADRAADLEEALMSALGDGPVPGAFTEDEEDDATGADDSNEPSPPTRVALAREYDEIQQNFIFRHGNGTADVPGSEDIFKSMNNAAKNGNRTEFDRQRVKLQRLENPSPGSSDSSSSSGSDGFIAQFDKVDHVETYGAKQNKHQVIGKKGRKLGTVTARDRNQVLDRVTFYNAPRRSASSSESSLLQQQMHQASHGLDPKHPEQYGVEHVARMSTVSTTEYFLCNGNGCENTRIPLKYRAVADVNECIFCNLGYHKHDPERVGWCLGGEHGHEAQQSKLVDDDGYDADTCKDCSKDEGEFGDHSSEGEDEDEGIVAGTNDDKADGTEGTDDIMTD